MLNIDNIDAYYGRIKVLHDVSLQVKEGQIVALIGANGAGKTTLLKTLSGLMHPKQGHIKFLDKNIEKLPPEKIVSVGMSHVPEGRKVFSKRTVYINLEMGAFLRKDKKEIKKDIQKYLDLFPILGDRSNQLAGTLSGGEQQMLALARGLMARPKLLLLDEPSMGLSPKLVNEIFQIIKKLHETGISILLVEQNVKKALSITQYAYVMELGKIPFQGKSQELIKSDQISKYYLGGE